MNYLRQTNYQKVLYPEYHRYSIPFYFLGTTTVRILNDEIRYSQGRHKTFWEPEELSLDPTPWNVVEVKISKI